MTRLRVRVTRVIHETVEVEVSENTYRAVMDVIKTIAPEQRQLEYEELYVGRAFIEIPLETKPTAEVEPMPPKPVQPGTQWLRDKVNKE